MIEPTIATPRLRLESVAEQAWCPRRIVRVFDGLVVGELEFHGPPETGDDGVVEVEVEVRMNPDARGFGAGTESLQGLLTHTDRAAVRVRARVRPENTSGVRLLAKCGFTGLRGSDEDGNLVMVRPVAS